MADAQLARVPSAAAVSNANPSVHSMISVQNRLTDAITHLDIRVCLLLLTQVRKRFLLASFPHVQACLPRGTRAVVPRQIVPDDDRDGLPLLLIK